MTALPRGWHGAPVDLDVCLQVAISAAEDAGKVALRHFRGDYAVRDKAAGGPGRFDPVTRADEEIEHLLRREILSAFPDHAILGEESGGTMDGPVVWILDPIDGTKSFLAGLPLWGILVGLVVEGGPALGVMHQPVLGETFVGTGDRAWLRTSAGERTLATSDTTRVEGAIIGCTDPRMFDVGGYRTGFAKLTRESRLLRYGGDCYSYCMVALGQMDAVVERGLQPYDILPLVPIVTGAGGSISSPDGGITDGGTIVAAATENLHRRLVGLLSTPEPVTSGSGV